MKHRDFNIVEGWIGAPQSGKTESMTFAALELQRRTRAYLLAHDVSWKIPDVLHDGTRVPIVRHVDEASARAAIAKMTGPALHSISSDDARETIKLARDVAQASLDRFKDPPPVLLLFDEIVASELADKGNLERDLRRLITDRRHAHVGIFWGVQHLRFVNNGLVALSTKIHIARMTDEYSEEQLVRCGVQPEDAEKVKHLKEHEFHSCIVS
jgi:hypothetical protein